MSRLSALIPALVIACLCASHGPNVSAQDSGRNSSGKSPQTQASDSGQSASKPDHPSDAIQTVATFRGLQVTGVTVSNSGRIFANFPRWREGVPVSVVEVDPKTGSYEPYPNAELNRWQPNTQLGDEPMFVAVQSVVAFENQLYVIDTRNPFMKGQITQPRIYVIDLDSNSVVRTYVIPESAAKKQSYVNDLRVDKKRGKIYCTDSAVPGLLVIDIASGQTRRILDHHPSTSAETDHLTVAGQRFDFSVNSDGIALDTKRGKLFYHALTGYHLYALPTQVLEKDDQAIEAAVEKVAKTSAPDGMIVDDRGNLYYGDLERNTINYLTVDGKQKTLVQGDAIHWPDSFSIHEGWLYFTNSRVNQSMSDISNLDFTIVRTPVAP